MQKKLIALAVAAAFAAPLAAHADVTIYGKMHASWDYIDTDDNTGDESDDATAVFRASRLGFKGSENLGGGLKAIWQVETQIQTADGDNGGDFDLRNTFVGLSGGWGTLILGRHDTPYKISTGKLDQWADTIADYNVVIGSSAFAFTEGFNERVPQTVAYITPNFNGFVGAVARVSAKLNEDTAFTPATDDETEAWSFMGQYENGPIFLAAAYEVQSGQGISNITGGGSTGRDEVDAWKIGGGYTFGNTKIGAIYESIDSDANNSAASRDAWYINGSHAFGNNVVKAAYGQIDDSDANGVSDGADHWAIGLDHNFSKRTTVYAIYATMDNDKDAQFGLKSGQQVGTGPRASGAGNDVDAVSVGIIHKF